MKKLFKIVLFVFLLLSIFTNCTEPYALQTNAYEDVLVVEATITNEYKKQEIVLSRTQKLEDTTRIFEKNAIVYITDDLGNFYEFEEHNNKYLSKQPFAATSNVDYQLFINTSNGISYTSNKQKLTKENTIESVDTRVITKNGTKGVEINVSHNDPTNTSRFYRYTYEETSKITVPKWSNLKIKLVEPVPQGIPGDALIVLEPRTEEAKTCFTTKKSDKIFLNNTNQLAEDRITNFPLRFIDYKDYTVAERYSIKVNLYTQNLESYTYHNTLKKLTETEDVLSPTQPGYVVGNITSTTDPKMKTIGFFEVSSVTSKRIFFNYFEAFPDENILPDFYDTCEEFDFRAYDYEAPPKGGVSPAIMLRRRIRNGELILYQNFLENDFLVFRMVKPICGDCTTFSSNIRPDFWID